MIRLHGLQTPRSQIRIYSKVCLRIHFIQSSKRGYMYYMTKISQGFLHRRPLLIFPRFLKWVFREPCHFSFCMICIHNLSHLCINCHFFFPPLLFWLFKIFSSCIKDLMVINSIQNDDERNCDVKRQCLYGC